MNRRAMFSRKNRLILLAACATTPVTVGCFLGGDYRPEERTVTAPDGTVAVPSPSTEASSALGSSPSDPTSPSSAGPAPTEPNASSRDDETSSQVAAKGSTAETAVSTETPSGVTGSPTADTSSAPESLTSDTATSVDTSTSGSSQTGASGTNPWSNSSGNCYTGGQGGGGQGGQAGGGQGGGGFGGSGNCPAACKDEEVQDAKGRCYWFGTTLVTRAGADSTCRNRGDGWQVVTLHTEEEDLFVREQVIDETWIGASYQGGWWIWVDDGSRFWTGRGKDGRAIDSAYASWGTNEPSDSNGEACVRYLSSNGVMKWSGTECTDNYYRAACQGPTP